MGSSSHESHPSHIFIFIAFTSSPSINHSQILHEAISILSRDLESILSPQNGTINLPSRRHDRPSCQRQLGNGSAEQQAIDATRAPLTLTTAKDREQEAEQEEVRMR